MFHQLAATASSTPIYDAITSNTSGLKDDLLKVGGAAIVVSAGIYGLRKGWGFFRGLVKG